MKLVVFFVLMNIIFFISCKQTSTEKETKKTSSKDTTTFFPVADYIQQQIKLVDSTPYFMYLISIRNGKKDSSQINTHQFDSLVQPFREIDISNPSIKKNYTESVFEDKSTQSYTLTYSTNNKSLSTQNIDVLLNEENQQVKRIFINCFYDNNDSAITQKLGWKSFHSCSIIRIIQYKNGKQSTEQNLIVWNDKD
ncbi:MAG: hypothetical protein ACR2FN_14365 [Chitinophagaceae bacterium]